MISFNYAFIKVLIETVKWNRKLIITDIIKLSIQQLSLFRKTFIIK